MVRIRLMRVGKKKQPSYRVVVADQRSPRDGRIIEAIGHYQPRLEPSQIAIDNDRALHWLARGAQPSNQVRKLLQISGAWSAFTGEAPPPAPVPAAGAKKPTPAASVKATPAASVAEEASPDTAPEGAEPAELPEAVDQAPAAPEADVDKDEA
ncbi:MAG: 30S ribosomal protein S16 [Actinomycetota bacterium]